MAIQEYVSIETIYNLQLLLNKCIKKAGSDLLSRGRAAVPSARERFTSVFGMGTGISTLPWPPADHLGAPGMAHLMVGEERRAIWPSLTAD